MSANQISPNQRTGRKTLWIRIFLPALALLSVALLAGIFLKGRPYPTISPPNEQVHPDQGLPGPSVLAEQRSAAVTPEKSAIPLKEQLQQVVAGMQEANQKKDLSKLLSYYSPNFPGLPQRTQSISKAWKIYDYPKIAFEITDIKPLNDNAVMARVTWEAEARNINTQKSQNISKTYLIRFVKESGQWRILTLENVK